MNSESSQTTYVSMDNFQQEYRCLQRQGIPAAIVMKIAGWKDLKTMQRYIRLAGVEVTGATDKLSVLPPEEVAANVVAFRPRA